MAFTILDFRRFFIGKLRAGVFHQNLNGQSWICRIICNSIRLCFIRHTKFCYSDIAKNWNFSSFFLHKYELEYFLLVFVMILLYIQFHLLPKLPAIFLSSRSQSKADKCSKGTTKHILWGSFFAMGSWLAIFVKPALILLIFLEFQTYISPKLTAGFFSTMS